ncbi:MAG: nitrous oxide reductase accessory protein NosL [Nitrospirota bacterium]
MRWYFLALIILSLAACSKEAGTKPLPVEFTRDHVCKVCGMIIVDFPGAKGQIHYKNGRFDAFCSTLDMFLFYLQPDRPRNITAIYVNDMGVVGETRSLPRTNWIDARNAFYVYGGDIMGPMGEALVPFLEIKDAEVYIKKHGGRIIRFSDVEMEILRPK